MSAKAAATVEKRVLIVAEAEDRRARLRAMLSSEPGFRLSEAAVWHLDDSAAHTPETVVILDISSDNGSPPPPLPSAHSGLVLLAEGGESVWLAQALASGPTAVLTYDVNEKQIIAAVRAVASGLTVLDQDAVDALLRNTRETVALEPGEEELTSRETEVLHMMTSGFTNREIASVLKISEHTVKFHIASIFGKLGTSTRTEAVTEGLRRGLILL